MVPESNFSTSSSTTHSSDIDEDDAMRLISDLGYPSCHTLLPALLAHLTRRPAFQEKQQLERLLLEQALFRSQKFEDKQTAFAEEALERIKSDRHIQRALTIASYSGCNLMYSSGASVSPKS